MAPFLLQVNILSAGYVQKSVIADTAKQGLTSAVSLVPFVALVLLRTCKPLHSFSQPPMTKLFGNILSLSLMRADFNICLALLEACLQADLNCICTLSSLLLISLLKGIFIRQRPSNCLASSLILVTAANVSSSWQEHKVTLYSSYTMPSCSHKKAAFQMLHPHVEGGQSSSGSQYRVKSHLTKCCERQEQKGQQIYQ